MSKVCILALDALEYDLVEEFDLKALKQAEYGKVDVSMFKDIATPIIWASFITGLPPEKHKIQLTEWRNPILQKLHELTLKLKLDKIKGKGKIFEWLGFRRGADYEQNIAQFKKYRSKSLFHIIPNAKAITVPPYQKWISEKTREYVSDVAHRRITLKSYERYIWKIFYEKRRRYFKTLLEGDWNLIMTHFMFTDLFGHFFITDYEKMLEVYLEAEQLVKDTQQLIGDETWLLIVSDHGMEPLVYKARVGDHSDHGFYSSNVKLGLANPKITDFFDLIVRIFKSAA
jgi:predicted AlkP superfamily pyrophosphatase or phosphodiesterase